MTDVICGRSVLSFDGRVVEAFGFLNQNPERVHVQQVTKVELKGKTLKIDHPPASRMTVMIDGDDAKLAEVQKLVDQIRAAAPNLEA